MDFQGLFYDQDVAKNRFFTPKQLITQTKQGILLSIAHMAKWQILVGLWHVGRLRVEIDVFQSAEVLPHIHGDHKDSLGRIVAVIFWSL